MTNHRSFWGWAVAAMIAAVSVAISVWQGYPVMARAASAWERAGMWPTPAPTAAIPAAAVEFDPRDMTTWTRDHRRQEMQRKYEADLADNQESATATALTKLRLAYVHDRRENYTAAIKLYREVIDAQSTGHAAPQAAPGRGVGAAASAYHNLAIDLARVGRSDEAMEALTRGIRAVRDVLAFGNETTDEVPLSAETRGLALLHYARGSMMAEGGWLRLAERAFDEAFRADPSSEAAAANLAAVRRELGFPTTDTLPPLARALHLNPAHAPHAVEHAILAIEHAMQLSFSSVNGSAPTQRRQMETQLRTRLATDRNLAITKAAVQLALGRGFAAHDALESSLVRNLRRHNGGNTKGLGDLHFQRDFVVGGVCDAQFVQMLTNVTQLTSALFDFPAPIENATGGAVQFDLALDSASHFWQPRLTRRSGFSMLRLFDSLALSGRIGDPRWWMQPPTVAGSHVAHASLLSSAQLREYVGDERAFNSSSAPFQYFSFGATSPATHDLLHLHCVVVVTSLAPLRVWALPRISAQIDKQMHAAQRHAPGRNPTCTMDLDHAVAILRRTHGLLVPSGDDIKSMAFDQAAHILRATHNAWRNSHNAKSRRQSCDDVENEAVSVCPFKLLAVDFRLMADNRLVAVRVLDRFRFEDSEECVQTKQERDKGSNFGAPVLSSNFGTRAFSKMLIDVTGSNGAHQPWHRTFWANFSSWKKGNSSLADTQPDGTRAEFSAASHPSLAKFLREYSHRHEFQLLWPLNDSTAVARAVRDCRSTLTSTSSCDEKNDLLQMEFLQQLQRVESLSDG